MKWSGFIGCGFSAVLCVSGTLVCLPGLEPCRAGDSLPDASQVTRRLLERAQAVAQAAENPQYQFQSRAVSERLDAHGNVIESEERIYEVEWIGGLPFKRLVRVQGRDLSPDELNNEQQREEHFREKLTSMSPRKLVARRQSVVTAQLLDRYRFQVKERVLLGDRPTLVVSFEAKDDPLSGGTIQDKVLNRLGGTLWIDETDADTAKLTITLLEPLSLGWLGFLGSLTQCDFRLERQRMPDGLWINARQFLQIHYRKLAATTRFRRTEWSSGFKKVE